MLNHSLQGKEKKQNYNVHLTKVLQNMVNMDAIQNRPTLRFKEQSQQPYKSCLIQNQNTKSKPLAALLNNAHGSKMRDSFIQG